jgi:predicted NUDIX family NTP pyrophosphohydrolase
MNQAKILIASAAAAAVSLGFSLQPHPAPFWETNIVIAGEESVPKGNVQSGEDSSGAKSAKMGKDEGTQTGGPSQGTPTEKDTQKIDQPPPQNPTTGQQ